MGETGEITRDYYFIPYCAMHGVLRRAWPKPTDPVCCMGMNEDASTCTTQYKGQEYFFCLDFCEKKNEERPLWFATRA